MYGFFQKVVGGKMLLPKSQGRMNFVFALVSIVLFSTLASAQQQAVPLSVKRISDSVYWTQGGAGGNTGIIIGKDGVIVVDAKTTPASAKEVLAEIAKLTPKPVTTVMITHSDGDHVNSLAAFPTGLTIISQEGCKKEMEASAGARNTAPQDHLPTKTIDKKESLTINGVRFTLLNFGPAHTSGDLIVFLPDEKVVFTGDLVVTNQPDPYPIIHLNKHGSSQGWVQNMRGITALKADKFVPGHGDLQTKANLQKMLDSAQNRREEIKKMVAQGKSLADVEAALGEPAGPATPQSFTEVVFTELSKS
jgi:cyclase